LNSFVFDPGLGQVRAGFFFSRYGFNFRAIGKRSLKSRKNKRREKNPAPGCGTYSPSGA
jgi:hypothetical protein